MGIYDREDKPRLYDDLERKFDRLEQAINNFGNGDVTPEAVDSLVVEAANEIPDMRTIVRVLRDRDSRNDAEISSPARN
jgi:hypothetical protein